MTKAWPTLPSPAPRLTTLALVAGVVLGGCGSPRTLEFPERQPTLTDPAEVGSVTGTVRLAGTPPPREEIPLGTAGACAAHANPLTESVVAEGDKLQNAVVYVKSGLEGQVFAISREPVTIDQKGCVFLPHVVAVQAYQPVRFLNSDPMLHNVRSAAERNKPFNLALDSVGSERLVQFPAPEFVPIKCDVHGWMTAYVAVIDHPHHAVTGRDGAFTLNGLPAGKYVLEAWHEALGTRQQEVVVAAGGRVDVAFSFTAP